MRCFIAIDIDESIRGGLGDLEGEIRSIGSFEEGHVKWVDPAKIHLTLKFLGEVPDRDIIGICKAVEDAAGRHKGFELSVRGCGTFGRPARVFWVGVDDSEGLLGLQSDVEALLGEAGWKPEGRKYSGHLTLCRIKNTGAGRKMERIAKEHKEVDLGSCFVDSVCVYKSELTSKGSEYTLVSRSRLNG